MVLALLGAAALAFALATGLFTTRLVRYEVGRSPFAEGAMAVATALLLGAAVVGIGGSGTSMGGGGHLAVLLIAVAASATSLVLMRWGAQDPAAGRAAFPMLGPVTSAMVGMVALALLLHGAFPPGARGGPMSGVTMLHIAATLVGYLLFAPAFVLGNLYIGQSWRLKTKQLSSAKLPPLVTLETSAWRLLTVGFVLYTLGIVGGYVSSESGHESVRPQHVVAALAWLVYATALVRRYASGWRGVRAAVALLAGFVITSGAVLLYVLR